MAILKFRLQQKFKLRIHLRGLQDIVFPIATNFNHSSLKEQPPPLNSINSKFIVPGKQEDIWKVSLSHVEGESTERVAANVLNRKAPGIQAVHSKRSGANLRFNRLVHLAGDKERAKTSKLSGRGDYQWNSCATLSRRLFSSGTAFRRGATKRRGIQFAKHARRLN